VARLIQGSPPGAKNVPWIASDPLERGVAKETAQFDQDEFRAYKDGFTAGERRAELETNLGSSKAFEMGFIEAAKTAGPEWASFCRFAGRRRL
jgi:hypothetical protein